ncbi:MAG: hypothetical protein H4O13_07365 [Xanthomonadales bacterium]|nr:hypothetical protein [Xanthomonadales bacterium]
MRRALLLFALLLAPLATLASPSHSERCGQSVITVGAPVTKLRACGTPWRIVTLVNEHGAAVAERWEFERDTGLALFTVRGGRVVRIERV